MARIKGKEAGGVEVRRGRPIVEKKPTRNELKMLYVKEQKSIREVAFTLKCSKDLVYRALKEYKIDRRERVPTSPLKKYSIDELKDLVEAEGYAKTGRKLGVSRANLFMFIKRHSKEE